jgi:hypothetical protein
MPEQGAGTTTLQGTTSNGSNVNERIHALEISQAVQAATMAGAEATQAAVQAGNMATTTAMSAGNMAVTVAGSVALVVGIFMGLAIGAARR